MSNFYFSISYSFSFDRKFQSLSVFRLTNCQKDLADEREMINALRSNQSAWKTKCATVEEKFNKYQAEKEAQIGELKDEIRDLMFYMEAQNVVANSQLKDEIADTSISITQPPETSGSATSNSKKSRRKKN